MGFCFIWEIGFLLERGGIRDEGLVDNIFSRLSWTVGWIVWGSRTVHDESINWYLNISFIDFSGNDELFSTLVSKSIYSTPWKRWPFFNDGMIFEWITVFVMLNTGMIASLCRNWFCWRIFERYVVGEVYWMSSYRTKWALSLWFVYNEVLEARDNSVLIDLALSRWQVTAYITVEIRVSSLPKDVTLAER